MNLLRPLVALALVALAIWVGMTFVVHHEVSDPNSDAFNILYQHLMPAPLVVDGHAPAPGAAAGEQGSAGHATPRLLLSLTLPGLPGEFATAKGSQPLDMDPSQGYQLVATNLQVFQLAAVLLILVCFGGVARHVRQGGGDWLSRKLSGFVLWVRDEMVYPVMGATTGRRFLPFFLTIFFFVLFMNLLGLFPGGATATASIFVTAALATITLLSMIICGMVVQGPIAFWKHLVPHVPLALWPLMFVVELIGLMVKPFALTIRLFANMTGGHMVVLSFMGLIFFFAGEHQSALGWGVSPVAVSFAVFIMIIEAFVALLQAYIFTQLSILFVSASMHPEH